MQNGISVQTKFLGPTNSRGSRVKATCFRGSVVIHWEHGSNSQQNHLAAVKALCEKFWPNAGQEVIAFGESIDGRGYVAIVTFPGGANV